MHVQCGIHTHIHARIRLRTHTYILAYIHSYTHTSVHACVRVRILPHVHTWRACKHTYMSAGAESTGAFRFGASQRDECCTVFSVYFLWVILKIVFMAVLRERTRRLLLALSTMPSYVITKIVFVAVMRERTRQLLLALSTMPSYRCVGSTNICRFGAVQYSGQYGELLRYSIVAFNQCCP